MQKLLLVVMLTAVYSKLKCDLQLLHQPVLFNAALYIGPIVGFIFLPIRHIYWSSAHHWILSCIGIQLHHDLILNTHSEFYTIVKFTSRENVKEKLHWFWTHIQNSTPCSNLPAERILKRNCSDLWTLCMHLPSLREVMENEGIFSHIFPIMFDYSLRTCLLFPFNLLLYLHT